MAEIYANINYIPRKC